MKKIYILVFVCLLHTPCIANQSDKWLNKNDIRSLYQTAKKARREFNIRVDSETWLEWKADITDPNSTWERTPACAEATSWYEVGFKGRVRIDVHKEVLPWLDAEASFAETSYSQVYNGKRKIHVVHSTGYDGKKFPGDAATIDEYSLKDLQERALSSYSGIGFYSHYYLPKFNAGLDSVLERISNMPDSNDVAKASQGVYFESLKGTDSLVIANKDKKNRITQCWLDPAKNFSLMKFVDASVSKNGEQRISLDIEVKRVEEVSPGIWWPMEVFCIVPAIGPKGGWNRSVYRASEVQISTDPFPDSLFELEIPDGYMVSDSIAKKNYRKGSEKDNKQSK